MDSSTATTPSSANGRLTSELKHIVGEAEALLRTAADSGDQKLEALRQNFEQQLRRMRAQLDEAEETTARRAREAVHATDHAVHAHPYGAMGLAAAVGLLVGTLIARR